MKIALVGGGPSALFLLKQLIESPSSNLNVEIFERGSRLGEGMPYGAQGAGLEHVTNVSSNELPKLADTLFDWVLALPEPELNRYGINRARFREDRIVPRLLFGDYLAAQFQRLLAAAPFPVEVRLSTPVLDVIDRPELGRVEVVSEGESALYDYAVICSGHHWPRSHEGRVPGYFDSPYPPGKLAIRANHPVALRGSSLTAVDAIRTLSRHNGKFVRREDGELDFLVDPESPDFELVMHNRNGLLPCVRIHLEDPQVTDEGLLQPRDWLETRRSNDGFVPLDLFFEEDFKQQLRDRDPAFFEKIREMTLEQFVEAGLQARDWASPFEALRAEYRESRDSLRKRRGTPWKEALSVLSFSVNVPAKHFSAEDSLRLKEVLAPLISLVIAFMPYSTTRELLALHAAGRLSLVEVGSHSEVVPAERGVVYRYKDEQGKDTSVVYSTFVDCVGQPALDLKDFPFHSLVAGGVIRQARLRFRDAERGRRLRDEKPDEVELDDDGSYHLLVPGIAINDNYQPLDREDRPNPRISVMSVPFLGGHNPDYSGVDFCEKASELIVKAMFGRVSPAPFSGSAG